MMMMMRKNKHLKRLAITAAFLIACFSLTFDSVQAFAITVDTSAQLHTLTNDNVYEKSIAVSVKFTPILTTGESVENPKIYIYAKKQGSSLSLASTTKDASAFVNETLQTVTATLKIDEQSYAGAELAGDDTIIIYSKIYNTTIDSANLLSSDSTSLSYGSLVDEDSIKEPSTTRKLFLWAIILCSIVIFGSVLILIIVWTYNKARAIVD